MQGSGDDSPAGGRHALGGIRKATWLARTMRAASIIAASAAGHYQQADARKGIPLRGFDIPITCTSSFLRPAWRHTSIDEDMQPARRGEISPPDAGKIYASLLAA